MIFKFMLQLFFNILSSNLGFFNPTPTETENTPISSMQMPISIYHCIINGL